MTNWKDEQTAKIVSLAARGPVSESMDGATEALARQTMDKQGMAETTRLNIPTREVHAFDQFADLLRGLANRLEAIKQAEHLNYYEKARRASSAVRSVHMELKSIGSDASGWKSPG